VAKYIRNVERAFAQIRLGETPAQVERERVNEVLENARCYLEDAKYYRKRNMWETSLATIAYCEGLLDALRILGLVEFSW